MFNPVEPSVDQPQSGSGGRPSAGRIAFWSFTLGVLLLGLAGGAALLIASNQLDATVQTYRNAPPCPGVALTASCYTLVPGTLTKFSVSHGKSGDTADITLQLPDGDRTTWAKTNWRQEDALQVGAAVRAKFYQGALTAVYVGGVEIQTKDNPIYKQSDMRLGAVLIPVLGLIIAGVSFFSLRRRTPTTVGSITTIDTTLSVEEQERLIRQALLGYQPAETPFAATGAQPAGVTLPFTLRPHPMPTGRPWWVALIVVAIGVPMLLLRSRTPAPIAQIVLVVTVAGMLSGVVLHWLYRNRRILVVDDLSVRRINLFGFSRVVSRTDIARVAFPLVSSSALPGLEPRLLLLDATGRCMLSLRRYHPTDEEAAQLAAVLRVPLDVNLASRLTTATRLSRNMPGAVTWWEAHPFLMSAMFTPIILAAIVLFIWVLDGFKWSS